MNLTAFWYCGLGLGLVVSSGMAQVSTSCIPTKNQVALRQKVAELEAAQGRLDTRILQAEVQALKRRGLINEQQEADFASIIDQANAPKGPVDTPEGSALARQALSAKLEALQSVETAPLPETDPEIHAKAIAALIRSLEEMKTPAPPPEPDTSHQHAVALAALASVMTEMSAGPRIAEDDAQAAMQAKAQAALAAKMAELDRQAATEAAARLAPPPTPAPVVAAPTPAPIPVPAPPQVVVAPPEPAPAPVAEVVVPAGEDRRAAALAALEEKLIRLNEEENVSLTGVPVQVPPLRPAEQLQASQILRETVAAPFAQPPETPRSPRTGWDRIAELTELYRANQITPQEYHVERAKVVESMTR